MKTNTGDSLIDSGSGNGESSALYYQNLELPGKKIIEIKDLRKKFGDKQVLNGLTVSLHQGEIFCLLGHNGAGKSTTVNIMTGLTPWTDGQILYYGQEVGDNFGNVSGKIGFCPQKDFIFAGQTVEENMQFLAEIKGISA
mmetsp:Transcript_21424/g.18527  ORF Transcript_21424/g.18527 Transcript_21424/m.18527 type:complete len:140 (-) Transcript_21424:1312-1731(-)